MQPLAQSKPVASVAVISGSVSRLAGGLFESVRHSAQEISKLGHPVSVYGLLDAHSAVDHAAWAPLVPSALPSFGPAALGLPRGLRRHFDRTRPDILHQHGIWMGLSHTVASWGYRNGKPVVISPRGMLDPWALAQARAKKRIAAFLYETRNLRQANVIHALNRAEAQAIRAYGLSAPIALIPNGTELPDLSPLPPPPNFLQLDGRRTLLYIGRLHDKKCPRQLIEAWIAVCKDKPAHDWRLVVAGWGEPTYTRSLVSLAARAGLGDRLILLGPVYGGQKKSLFANADAFILPSLSEGLPVSVLEAWSYGLPVFMSHACNLPEGFSNGAALPVSCDPASLANDLRAFLSRDDLVKIGSHGRRLVESRFTWEKVGRDFSDVYSWCRSGGTPPNCIELT